MAGANSLMVSGTRRPRKIGYQQIKEDMTGVHDAPGYGPGSDGVEANS